MNWALWYLVKQNVNKQKLKQIKLGGFQSQLEVSYMSSHTEELW